MANGKRILITGASGLVGSRLSQLLLNKGYEVQHLARKPGSDYKTFLWDVNAQTIDTACLDAVDAIIHLAGANISEKRWTTRRKKEIVDSRVKSTELLFKTLQHHQHRVGTFLSASAVGYYGFKNSEKIYSEEMPAGDDFLAQVTNQWEQAVDPISSLGIRVVKMRTGVVLAKDGGALKPISNTVKFWVGAPLGSGNQYISWIHLDDLCEMFIYALEHPSLSGAINAVAPSPVTNRQLTEAIAHKLNKPMFLPSVPGFALRLALGEMADLVLEGSQVSSKKILQAGFKFRFSELKDALGNLLKP